MELTATVTYTINPYLPELDQANKKGYLNDFLYSVLRQSCPGYGLHIESVEDAEITGGVE